MKQQQEEPLIKKIPTEKLMRKLIRDEFRFQRRQYIFLNVNTVNLILTLYNLISPINIEGQRSLIFYEETRESSIASNLTLINLLDALIVVHLLRIFTCLLGYFSVSQEQKSGRIITYFMIMSSVCVLSRGIVSLLIILNYSDIKSDCESIFQIDGTIMAVQFLVVLIFFVVVEILLALISLIQCSKSKEEYEKWLKDKEKLMKIYELCYEVALYHLDE